MATPDAITGWPAFVGEVRGKLLSNPPGVHRDNQRRTPDTRRELNSIRLQANPDPEIASRISQYELAFRMQSAATDLTDVFGETQATLDAHAFSMRMAGGGAKGGTVHGVTDEIGWAPVEDSVHVNDFQATRLCLFGLDHERPSVNHQGLNVQVTNLKGEAVHNVLA